MRRTECHSLDCRCAAIAIARAAAIELHCPISVQCYIAAVAGSKSKSVQLELRLSTHGGAREGAGCKRKRQRATVKHVRRAPFRAWKPVLVTMRMCRGIPNLRERSAWAVIVRTMRAVRASAPLRVVQYSVMSNHIHAIVEADGHAAFVAGMRALTIRLARALNGHFERTGRVLDHRYDARSLGSPREVRHALQYVLLNARKHAAERGEILASDWIDRRSTAACFDGWLEPPSVVCAKDFGIAAPKTWLLRVGWREHGLLQLAAVPGPLAPQRTAP